MNNTFLRTAGMVGGRRLERSKRMLRNRPEPPSDPDIWLYRKKTTALLRRYMRWSLEAGRLPSVLGRELFRAKISAYTATTFEARVIFLHDIERCLGRYTGFDGQLISRVLLQEYDHEAAARMLGCARRTIERRLPELIDDLSERLLGTKLMDRFPQTAEKQEEKLKDSNESSSKKCCQEGKRLGPMRTS
jgi:DNA-directed RNA polymerase specialized sigma24 family protein